MIKYKEIEGAILIDDSLSYFQVCLTEGDGSGISIPLKDLVPTLITYVNSYGGEGSLKILMFYKNKKGQIKPIINSKKDKK